MRGILQNKYVFFPFFQALTSHKFKSLQEANGSTRVTSLTL